MEFWQGDSGAETDIGCLPHAVFAMAAAQCAETSHVLTGREPGLRKAAALRLKVQFAQLKKMMDPV